MSSAGPAVVPWPKRRPVPGSIVIVPLPTWAPKRLRPTTGRLSSRAGGISPRGGAWTPQPQRSSCAHGKGRPNRRAKRMDPWAYPATLSCSSRSAGTVFDGVPDVSQSPAPDRTRRRSRDDRRCPKRVPFNAAHTAASEKKARRARRCRPRPRARCARVIEDGPASAALETLPRNGASQSFIGGGAFGCFAKRCRSPHETDSATCRSRPRLLPSCFNAKKPSEGWAFRLLGDGLQR